MKYILGIILTIISFTSSAYCTKGWIQWSLENDKNIETMTALINEYDFVYQGAIIDKIALKDLKHTNITYDNLMRVDRVIKGDVNTDFVKSTEYNPEGKGFPVAGVSGHIPIGTEFLIFGNKTKKPSVGYCSDSINISDEHYRKLILNILKEF